MTDHPSTFKGDHDHHGGIQWDDRASLHHTGDGNGVLDGAKGLRSGSFAELVRHLMLLPEQERADYYIEKAATANTMPRRSRNCPSAPISRASDAAPRLAAPALSIQETARA